MKNILLLCLVLLITKLYAQTYSDRSGTSEGTYLLDTKIDLKYLSENSGEWEKHFKQTQEITFANVDFQNGGNFYHSGSRQKISN